MTNVTKMSSHVLRLIENSDFSRLPGGLLTRGHLRAFANEVGLDPEEIVKEYRAQFEGASLEEQPLKLRSSYQEPQAGVPRAASMLMVGLAIVLYFVFLSPARRPAEIEISADTAEVDFDEAGTSGTVVAAAAQSAQAGPISARADQPERVQIELRPNGVCWVSAVADGRLVTYRLMQDGERQTIDARNEILLRVGDAGAFAYSVNGGVGRPLGARGEAVSVRITRDNSDTWLTNDPSRQSVPLL
jgi:cytoskeletal protein RodZ